MTARARNVEETGDRILDAAAELFWERPTTDISLQEVARRAGVSVQTVIRRYGGRDGLFAATGERQRRRVDAQRREAPPGDIHAAVAVLVEHYEQLGDGVLRLLAESTRVPALREIVEAGRDMHVAWCRRVFADQLGGRDPADRERREAQLVAVCDVLTWKLLRRDAGLSRAQTEHALTELLTALSEVP